MKLTQHRVKPLLRHHRLNLRLETMSKERLFGALEVIPTYLEAIQEIL